MAEFAPDEYMLAAQIEEENRRYEQAQLNEALSNFPLILTPYEDVDYINEVENCLKRDAEDFKRILHAHLLSNGAAGGWLPEILKSAMKETMGFKDISEVDAFVQEHFKYHTFKEFIDHADDVVRVEEGQYHPVLDDPTHRELYEDAVASVKNKDDKERKKDEQIKRNLDNPESVRGFYEGVNQLRKAIQQAFDVHGLKDKALRYIPSMDGTDKDVPGINFNYVQTEFKNIFQIPLDKNACKKICGRSSLMKGIEQAKPECLIETITMHEYKTGGKEAEHPGMYIALKNGSKEYGPAAIEAAVEECRSTQAEVENRQTNRHTRDQMNFARRQQQQDRPPGESRIQREARERREEMNRNDAAATAALSVPPRSAPPPSSIPPSTNQRPRSPNASDSSGRLDTLARGGTAPSTSVQANVMSTRSDGRNEYGDPEDSEPAGYSDEDEDDDAVEKREEARKERERRQREQRQQESAVTPPEPAPSTVQQHPSSVSRSATPSYPEVASAAQNGRSSTPAATRSNPHQHGNFQNKRNQWENDDDEASTPTVVERKSPVQQVQQQQPPAAAPPQQQTSVFAPRPITSDDYQQQSQPNLQQAQPMQQQQQLPPGQQPYAAAAPAQQQQPSYPPSSFPPPTPTLPNVYGDGMQQVPPQLQQQQQPYVYPPQQQQMQPPQQYQPQGPYMGPQSIPPSPAPSQSNMVPGQPQIYHPVPHYVGYPPGSVPPTPGMPYGGVPPQHQHPGGPYPHPQQYPPPPPGAPYGYPQQPPMHPQQQPPYYQGAPNQPPMQQPQYPPGTPGYPAPGGGNNVAPVVNVHVTASPSSPSPSPPAGADHRNYNPMHRPAPAQNYPPDQRWQAPPGSHPPQQGYGQSNQGAPPPPHRQSPPRRDPPPPPFQQYYPNRDAPPAQPHYQQTGNRDDRRSPPGQYGGYPEGRRQEEPEELIMYDEDRAARQSTRSRGQTPMGYGGNRSIEGQRQGYDSGFGRGGGAGFAGVGDGRRDDRRFGEQQPPRGFAQNASHRQNDRPLRAYDDREGFQPHGTSTPLSRSPERKRLLNRMDAVDDPKKNIRWQIICILKNIRDRNKIRMRRGGNFDVIVMDELFELVQLGCGNEMELFEAIAEYPGNQFLEFLKEMDREGLICLHRDRVRRNTNNQMVDDVYYVLDPYLKPPSTFAVPRWA